MEIRCHAGMETDEIDGESIARAVKGDGPATLIFVHGFGCDMSDWTAQQDALSRHWRTINCDLPGHGRSSTPDHPGVDRAAGAVNGLKRRHGAGPVILVGHSMGCRVALQACARDPADIAAIILVDGSNVAEGGGQADPERFHRYFAEGGTARAMLAGLWEGMFLPDTDPELRAFLTARLDRFSEDFARETMLSFIEWDMASAGKILGALTTPLLLIQSTYLDGAFGRRSLTRSGESPWIDFVRARAPQAEECIVTGAGHFPHLEKPDIVTGAIETFVRKVLA
jgi:pimeloyl-ACP methyl ester carboxylesterase